ncbi:RHH-type proline utilization regulon transcriptional repressor/proline dehydrogenase/delta 1-pyrroline-5-carboxylate dehydrogenase [Desulfobaculum xiamenense]|uniref:L-glutamate gamma-semialdehyde dehydrogenase n=1 Tax=Desulfobaculum xiamenense TaxID=995050 RepID=A0A846QR30_9BACT|nr:proline dehydrogenase family protein [Desulfobaculum xiamenense]NJB67845.1 RHH-type proline utilization regulon transcriptional repressor/proline dehydrogenase/delta 1-pyrroline-5-carboxylate dehydrogenase [Desulfobaculum xiamenense]
MNTSELETRIIERGRTFFEAMNGEAPSVFDKGWWTGKVMDWSMRDEDFKVKLFRFVDALPALTTNESLNRHIREYFAADSGELPPVLRAGLKSASVVGRLRGNFVVKGISKNIERLARQFIVGEDAKEAVKTLQRLRKDGFAFTIDILGEATVGETEAEARLQEHLDLLAALEVARRKFKPLGGSNGEFDWGGEPIINLSVKASAFCSQSFPRDFEGSVRGIYNRLAPVYRRIIEIGGAMCIDMESLDQRDITIEVFKRLRSHDEFRHYPHLGIVLQSYLRDVDDDVAGLVDWLRSEGLPSTIRLVKGAYWDHEVVRARQQGLAVPVYTVKAETDAAYERNARRILENADICRLACASHNVRTIAAVMEMARELGVPEERYEFQALYGMAEPVRKGLLSVAGRVRLYCPYGELVPGMAYLVRRLLENTSNESFLRRSFADETETDSLLENPEETARRERAARPVRPDSGPGVAPFVNEPAADFTQAAVRHAFPKAIARIRREFGATHPLFIGGENVVTGDVLDSYNPADVSEIVGSVCQAGPAEIDAAIAAAEEALPAWRATPVAERTKCLFEAARIARSRIFDLAVLQVLEVGKQWDQAHADVAEAIDFFEYYGREMLRLGADRRMGRVPGEVNRYRYRPRGVAAVIAPWNFPLAISAGMCSAALVTGNCVLYKPSGLSSVTGRVLADLFVEAGIPAGVFNFVPGRSSVMGDHLVGHPSVNLIAFTGSERVGLHIMQMAAQVAPGQRHLKRVVAEMGGKNACIIDDDAELDEAVRHVLYSAFGYQGQKCSACSRVIVHEAIYDRFVPRLVDAARSMRIGPAEDPACVMGPLVDRVAQQSVLEFIDVARAEGSVLLSRMPDGGPGGVDASQGCYVPLTIVEGITPEHRIAQEEAFGPVLAVMKAKDFDQAIEWANSTRFALTGAVFSRSPAHLEQAARDFAVGNLYLNRNCTGALVERQPFGGFAMSGIGSKAGGPDYLLQFMEPYVVTENTMRRGFAPIGSDDDWV